MQLATQVELRGMAARLSPALGPMRARVRERRRERRLGVYRWVKRFIGEAFQVPFQLLIALGNPLLVGSMTATGCVSVDTRCVSSRRRTSTIGTP